MAVRSLKGAQEALEKVRLLQAEIDTLMAKHGIKAKQEEAAILKKAATDWAAKTDTETITLEGAYAQLRRDKYGGTWVTDENDLDGAPIGTVPLRLVLRRKFKKDTARRAEVWKQITKRVADPQGLTDAVEKGVLTLEEIQESYFEKEKAAYLRIYNSD